MKQTLEQIFKLRDNNTTIRKEFLAGFTTFVTMSYIIFVNPQMMASSGMDLGASFIGTCIAAAIACIAMGVFSNWPVGLAPGMGLNAFFTYTVVGEMGYSWEVSLGAVFIAGILFVIISVTPLRQWMLNSIPMNLRIAMGAGVGLFVGFIGLKTGGIIIQNESTFLSLGDFKNALKHLDQINDLDPTFTRSDKMKSVLVNYKEEDGHLKSMKLKLDNLNLNDDQKIYLYFGISKAFEDCKNFEESFKYIQLGNNLKFKNSNYNIKFDTDKIEKIQKIFDKIDFDYLSNKDEKLKPIFIIGMPRSGTSLVEQIISSHHKVQGLGELNFFNNVANKEFLEKNIFNHHDLNIENIKFITKKFNSILKNFNIITEKFTDKTLLNFYWVGLIKLCYPNAKIIHCTRNPKDNLLSIYKNLFDHEGGWCYNEENLVQYYKIYNKIIDYWKTKIPNFISDIKYEDLINEPKLHIKNLLKYCDLEWDDNCLEFYKNKNSIKTLSVKQARNQIYKSSVDSFKNYKSVSKDLFKSL